MIGSYDISKARAIWRAKIAADREAAFANNDIALRDAILANDSVAIAAATARRDQLRALGEQIDSAGNLTALKAITP